MFSTFQVQEGSPALKAGLEPFFDFILSIGNTRLVSSIRPKVFLNLGLLFLYLDVEMIHTYW